MHSFRSAVVLTLTLGVVTACTGVGTRQPLTAAQAVKITDSVRAFASTVADGVTHRGPAAWRDYLADSPTFFMASQGRIVFANNDAAAQGIQALTTSIAHIELRWGNPMRVDPLTSSLAMFGAPWAEVRVDAAGQRVEEAGYFTGLAELGPTGWRFRNAHWSVATSPSRIP